MKDDTLHKVLVLRVEALERQLKRSEEWAVKWQELWHKATNERDAAKHKRQIEDGIIDHCLFDFRDQIYNAFACVARELQDQLKSNRKEQAVGKPRPS